MKYIMKKNVTGFILINLIFLLTHYGCMRANDIKLNIGSSYTYINVNDPDYYFVDEYESLTNLNDQLGNISFGISKFYNSNFNWSINTNRLFNNGVKREVKRKKDNVLFYNKTSTEIDSLTLGYRVNRFNPSLIIAKVKVNKFLYHEDLLLGGEKETSTLLGFNLGYFINKKIITSLSYISPNKKLDLESAFSLNVNYIFRTVNF